MARKIDINEIIKKAISEIITKALQAQKDTTQFNKNALYALWLMRGQIHKIEENLLQSDKESIHCGDKTSECKNDLASLEVIYVSGILYVAWLCYYGWSYMCYLLWHFYDYLCNSRGKRRNYYRFTVYIDLCYCRGGVFNSIDSYSNYCGSC